MSIGIAPHRARTGRWALGPAALLGGVAAGALVARSPMLSVFLAGAAVIGLLVTRADATLLVPLTSLGLALGSSVIPGGGIWFLLKFALLAAVAATAVIRIAVPLPGHLPLRASFVLGSLALVAYAIVSITYSVAPGETLQHSLSLGILWLAVIAVPLGCTGPDEVATIIRRIGYVAAAFVVLGLLAWASGLLGGFSTDARFYGILLNPNTLGYFVAPILPALVVLAARADPLSHRRGMLIAVGIVALGLALSASRAGVLSAAVGVAVGLAASWRGGRSRDARRILAFVAVAVVAVLSLLAVSGTQIRVARSPRSETFLSVGTGGLRTIAWSSGLRLIGEHPMLGLGFGTTPVVFPERGDVPTGERLGRVHNSYLEAAIDLGWPGAIAMLLLGASGLVTAWRASRRADPSQVVAAALAAGVAGGLVEAVFESGLLAAGGLLAFHFWLVVALAHAVSLRAAQTG